MSFDAIVQAIKSEPEYPDPCPKLRGFIAEAIANKDEEHVLHMLRQAVRQTKESVLARLASTTPEIFTVSAHTLCGSCGRAFGWYPSEELARAAAQNNTGSMDEALYGWLCIEAVKPGIHPEARVVQWFQWVHAPGQPGRWEPSQMVPAWATNVCNFSMG